MSQKRDELNGATVLGKGRLEELAAITGGTGVVGSKAISHKSKARERFEGADEKKPDAPKFEADPESRPKPEFVIVDHEISPSDVGNIVLQNLCNRLCQPGIGIERGACGTNSCKSPNRFGVSSTFKVLKPVALPPGRLRLR
jgi:GTPase